MGLREVLSGMDVSNRADQAYYRAWRAFGRNGLGAVHESDGMLLVSSGLPLSYLNIAFVTRQLPAPEDQVVAAARFFDARGEPFIIRIREGLDPAAEAACERLGFPYSDTVPGMASTNMAAPPLPRGLEIRPVTSERELAAFRTVVARGFELDLEQVTRFVRMELIRDDEVECYLGLVDGEPVATSTLAHGGRVAGVYNVATLPEARRRGFGEALTWHAMSRGAAYGCDMATLQASEMGRPVYERMGFRLVSPYKTFHRLGL